MEASTSWGCRSVRSLDMTLISEAALASFSRPTSYRDFWFSTSLEPRSGKVYMVSTDQLVKANYT